MVANRVLHRRVLLLLSNRHSKSAVLVPKIGRREATQNSLGSGSGPSRKQITIANDDGRVKWGQLSTREKLARTTQKSFHTGIILTGVVMTVHNDFLLCLKLVLRQIRVQS